MLQNKLDLFCCKSQVPTFFTQIGKEDKRPIILPFYVGLRFLISLPPHPLESDCVKEVILLTRFSDTEVTKRFYVWADRERSPAIPRPTKLHPRLALTKFHPNRINFQAPSYLSGNRKKPPLVDTME